MSLPYMPLYVADYLQDTGHLSALEHGVYLLLIMHYWSNGGLPNDDRRLARIARVNLKQWLRVRQTVADFFDRDWTHVRIDVELAHAKELTESRVAAGRRGGLASAKVKRRSSGAQAKPVAKSKHTEPEPEPDSEREEEKETRASALSSFDQFWEKYPHKIGKRAALKAFGKARVPLEALLLGIDRYIAEKPRDRPWCNPATWLNQGRWEDQPSGETGRVIYGDFARVQQAKFEAHLKDLPPERVAELTGKRPVPEFSEGGEPNVEDPQNPR